MWSLSSFTLPSYFALFATCYMFFVCYLAKATQVHSVSSTTIVNIRMDAVLFN